MIPYHNIAKEIFTIPSFELASQTFGPFAVRWYGFMYVVGFIIGFKLLKARAVAGLIRVSYRACENLVTYLIVGMLIGARLTYALIYNWDYYSVNPTHIIRIWEGGLSFHGAAIGMVVASILFARRYRVKGYEVLDTLAFCAAPGLFVGRMGNFINGELYGRATDLPWAMIFPEDKLQLPRHPSQLYQGFTEGLVLFFILYWAQKKMLERKQYRHGVLGAIFLMGYGALRFLTEFAREPDAHLGFVLGPFSMGQVLCFLMFLIGVAVWFHAKATQQIFVPKPQTAEALAKED